MPGRKAPSGSAGTGGPAPQTIAAIATAEGRGALAVVRLSGREAIAVARRILPPAALADPIDSHRARLAGVRWPAGAPGSGALPAGAEADQVLVLPMLAPHSYTGEDTVEFFCHGGLMPARLVLAACRAAGARAAAAGEFTRRAFLNGRLTLSQAEAVADLIAAEHAAGCRAALAQLRGGLQRELATIEEPLRRLLIRLEGSLEFDQDGDGGPTAEEIGAILDEALRRVDRLLALAPAGRQLREGVQVVLAGPPNAGKSSLFNALLGRDRALVDARPGTTRDVVTASLEIDGILFVLHDTAGLRDGAEGVEALGMDRTRRSLREADIVLDLRPAAEEGGRPAAAAGREAGGPRGPRPDEPAADALRLPIATKCDLGPVTDGRAATSSLTGEGVEALRARLADEAGRRGLDDSVRQGILLNRRHQDLLLACRGSLQGLRDGPSPGEEVVATLLASVLQDLGEVGGRVFSERLLAGIFSRFCVGK